MGRPTALTEVTAKAIIDATLQGVHVEVAARSAGIASSTYMLWQAKGKRDLETRSEGDYPSVDASHQHEWPNLSDGQCWCGHTRYSAFVDRLLVAEAQAETRIVRKVRGAMDKDPRIALYFMERRWPKRWRRQDRLSVTAEEQETSDTSSLADEEPLEVRIAKTMAILERAGRLPSDR